MVEDPTRRLQTHVPGLDDVLGGGFFAGGAYIITGAPGTGKTVLGNQLAFEHARAGGVVVYVTLLTETHTAMLAHLPNFSFFDPALLSERLAYFNGYRALEDDGVAALAKLVKGMLHDRRATLLVIDGIGTVEDRAENTLEFQRFLRDLHTTGAMQGCTTILLGTRDGADLRPAHSVVDGVVRLHDEWRGVRVARELFVDKHRWSAALRGRHAFQISSKGVTVFPRLEALTESLERQEPDVTRRLAFGISKLDEMLGGGVLEGSVTTALGAPGAGKTLLGLSFLADGASHRQRGLYFGFYEPPARLLQKTDGVSLKLREHVEAGTIDLEWQPSREDILDALAQKLLRGVERQRASRVFIDGVDALVQATLDQDRLGRFVSSLLYELRRRGVTTIVASESSTETTFEPSSPLGALSAEVENILHLRYAEEEHQVRRLLSVVKTRESAFAPAICELTIDEEGMRLEPLITEGSRASKPPPRGGR